MLFDQHIRSLDCSDVFSPIQLCLSEPVVTIQSSKHAVFSLAFAIQLIQFQFENTGC